MTASIAIRNQLPLHTRPVAPLLEVPALEVCGRLGGAHGAPLFGLIRRVFAWSVRVGNLTRSHHFDPPRTDTVS
ncbi:hypothetical protein [Glycomyces sp. YM15]|uniref:hypothetical protein n=1 Tax=Glycomyces sp. YM15 TaxID=2800446 RepID=UPI0019644370|nr:hypothetical protein [Glycomyces sp. YM15]